VRAQRREVLNERNDLLDVEWNDRRRHVAVSLLCNTKIARAPALLVSKYSSGGEVCANRGFIDLFDGPARDAARWWT